MLEPSFGRKLCRKHNGAAEFITLSSSWLLIQKVTMRQKFETVSHREFRETCTGKVYKLHLGGPSTQQGKCLFLLAFI